MNQHEALLVALNALQTIDEDHPYPIAKHAIVQISRVLRPVKTYTNGNPQYATENPLDIVDRAYFAGKKDGFDEALTQPDQEPVAWLDIGLDMAYSNSELDEEAKESLVPLYTAPPSKPWVSLTDEEIVQIVRERGWGQSYFSLIEIIEFTRDNEAALRSKNDTVRLV